MRDFGEFFHKKRRATGLPLRKFCQHHGFDAGNLSKLERGLLPAPQTHEKLGTYARALGIQEGTDDWYEFFDLAAVNAGRIPSDIASDEEVLNALPVLFHPLRDKTEEEEQFRSLITAIRRELR
jgi:transcriptional regulator with XRE-family HTH domain